MKSMKVDYAKSASRDLLKYRSESKRLMAGNNRYARTELGDVRALTGQAGFRLRVGDFRVLFEKVDTGILVTRIGPRGSVHE
jgi:mRNA interferase RelE/StbE